MTLRHEKLFEEIKKNNIDALFVTGVPNIRYLTNFSGEDGFLLATSDEITLFVDSRFTLQAEKEAYEKVKIIEYKGKISKKLKEILIEKKIHWLGIEKERITYDLFCHLNEISFLKLVSISDLVEGLRIKKDESELSRISKACEIASNAFNETLKLLKEGVSENDIAAELEYQFRKHGGDKPSFDTIVASGERGALPHGVASHKKIAVHEPIVFDFGTFYEGYASDITRVVSIGEPDNEIKKTYKVVYDAQQLGVESAKENVKAVDLDKKIRDFITERGLGEFFTHGLGHGVGLEIHEAPWVNGNSEFTLEENMVVTIEPGVYFKDKFGLRLEDTIIVKKEAALSLINLPHEIIIL